MLKLIKYELRKQMLSKVIMAVVMVLLTALFMFVTYKNDHRAAYATLAVLFLTMVIAITYSAIEIATYFGKDITTKQGYMLFMIPYGSKTILAAKMLSAIVQVLITTILFGFLLALCVSVYLWKNYNAKTFFEGLIMLLEYVFEIDIQLGTVINTIIIILMFWVLAVTLSMFLDTVSTTLFVNRYKWSTIVCVAVYFLLFYLIIQGLYMVESIPIPESIFNPIGYIYMIIIDFALFFGTAWLMDKKLSI
ncbi:MAG: hypothetical protein IJ326_05340 [Lachnospiraceae bacterium]|nr:hypothetical protein [Lachnospiraceae bacterium]